jgi:uncharacterized protein (TIGR03437 family)
MHRLPSLCFLFSCAISAAPMLRLSNSVVTAEAAVGATPASQTLHATNAGDGTLSLSVSIPQTASWVAASVDAKNAIQFTFNTASLTAGTYTGRLTVSDPNAIDSPQVVIVTLFIGGWPPKQVDQYVAPGRNLYVPFNPGGISGCTKSPGNNTCPSISTKTQDGGTWLSVSYSCMGTGGFSECGPYQILVSAPSSMAVGDYSGTVTVDSQVIPVSMHVTTLPIALPSQAQISLRLAQNGPATTYPFLPYVSFSNSGLGTLQVTGVSGSGTGVSAYNYQGLAIVTVDPGSLAPGIYNDGMVTIQCNGANCPVQVPVSLEVVPQGPPIVNYQGAVDNATFSPTGSPGGVMVVKGEQLSMQSPQTASGTPLPTTLGGASVLVNGVATPLYYSSFGQIAFQVRASTYLGTALVQVIRDGQLGNTISVKMTQYAPGIVVVTDASYNVIDATHPAKAGSTLVFWALGLGATNPVVADGAAAPSNPLAMVTAPVSVVFGLAWFENIAAPSFVGLSPGSVGLYQVAATLPASTPAGTVSAQLQLPGGVKSNTVTIAVD